jgi:hypothetical protein
MKLYTRMGGRLKRTAVRERDPAEWAPAPITRTCIGGRGGYGASISRLLTIVRRIAPLTVAGDQEE